MSILRVVSDVHGCINNRIRFQDLPSYIELCQELGPNDYSVQLGDLGFDYTPLNLINSDRNKVILGNHSNYDTAFNYPHMLGHYGLVNLGPFEFFFVRGGFSIDKKHRIAHEKITGRKSWWEQEELTYEQGMRCIDEYELAKPDVLMCHDAPADIAFLIGCPEILITFGINKDFVGKTQSILQNMIDVHAPKLIVHGHFHKNIDMFYRGIRCMCIAERQYIDFDENWKIVGRIGEKTGSGA